MILVLTGDDVESQATVPHAGSHQRGPGCSGDHRPVCAPIRRSTPAVLQTPAKAAKPWGSSATSSWMRATHPDHCRRSRDSPAPGSTAALRRWCRNRGGGRCRGIAPGISHPVRSMPGWWRAGLIPTGHLAASSNLYRTHTAAIPTGTRLGGDSDRRNPSGLSKQAHTGHHHSTGSGRIR